MSDGTLAAALQESNDILQDEVSRLRETNATLRVVIRTLRRTNESLREQVSNASENDDTFKRFARASLTQILTLKRKSHHRWKVNYLRLWAVELQV